MSHAVAAVIKTLREEQGLSQEALAGRASLHRTYIGLVERGHRGLTLSAAAELAQGLGVSLSELILRAEAELGGR